MTDKYTTLGAQMDQIIHEANSEINNLRAKITGRQCGIHTGSLLSTKQPYMMPKPSCAKNARRSQRLTRSRITSFRRRRNCATSYGPRKVMQRQRVLPKHTQSRSRTRLHNFTALHRHQPLELILKHTPSASETSTNYTRGRKVVVHVRG